MTGWKPLIVSQGAAGTKVDAPLAALRFMDSIPDRSREEMLFEIAHKACKCASEGQVELASAFKVFQVWARSARLLAESGGIELRHG